MSSPVHHAKDLDAALMYAPPWARHQARPVPARPSAPVEWPPSRRHLGDSPTFSGDRAVSEVQRQLALNPDSVPEPPRPFVNNETVGRIVLRLCGVLGTAAIITWVIVSVPMARLLGQETVQTSFPAAPISSNLGKQDRLAAATATRPEQPDTKLGGGEGVLQEPGEQALLSVPARAIVAGATVSERPAPVMTQGPPPTAQPISPGLITRQLDRGEVTSLVKRGEDFITSGDLASARLVLRRAADAGDARAALALAGTFDPNMVEKLGIQGLAADPAMARFWYERAEKFGAPEAPRRLQQLATQVNSVP